MTKNSESFLSRLVTRSFVFAISASVAVYLAGFFLVLYFNLATLDSLTKVIDAGFKAAVVIASSIWALNRYYVLRTDVPQLAVNSQVRIVEFDDNEAKLFLLWLDLKNTGRTLVETFEHFVEVHALGIDGEIVTQVPVHRWPESGTHPGGPIEPGSWAAINDQFCCPADVRAVRVFIAVTTKADQNWTWHRSFDVSKEVGE